MTSVFDFQLAHVQGCTFNVQRISVFSFRFHNFRAKLVTTRATDAHTAVRVSTQSLASQPISTPPGVATPLPELTGMMVTARVADSGLSGTAR